MVVMAHRLDKQFVDAQAHAAHMLSTKSVLKIVDGPLFHGTRRATLIKKNGFAPSTGGEFGPGIYLTAFAPTAEFYALRVASGPEPPAVITCRASIINPFVITKTDWIALTANKTPRTIQRHLVNRGHDGLVGLGLTGDPQVIVFAPEQVRFVSARAI